MAKFDQKKKATELEPGAWERFERAVDVVAKSPPQHRTKDKKVPEEKTKEKSGLTPRVFWRQFEAISSLLYFLC